MKNETTSSATASILVVDDNRENLLLLSQILQGQGYNVRPSVKGKLALASAQTLPPDLILLDIRMPEMSGYEVCEQLKADERTRDIPVIFISALNEEFDKVKAFEIGGVDYITKPFQPKEVLARVALHLSTQRMEKQLQEQNVRLQQEIMEREQVQQQLQQYQEHLEDLVRERTNALQQELLERQRIEAALQHAKNAAEAANRAKSQFLTNITHELRTPMNAILGFAQILLRDRTLKSNQQEHLKIIRRSGEQLLTLIDELLEMASIESGQISLHLSRIDLWHTLTTIKEAMDMDARQKGLTFTIEYPPELPQYIQTDGLKLRQVLMSLVSNAIKFTEQGRVILRAEAILYHRDTLSQDESSCAVQCLLQFEVEDTGIGIAPDEQERIFKTFERMPGIEAVVKGAGLGLAISRRFVRLLKGSIEVESDLGHGATFRVRIPVNITDRADEELETSPQQVVGLAPDQPTYRVLVVEDHPTNRRFVCQLLRFAGFEIREATNGQEAVEQFTQWSPHLICMDMRMPVMDGFEAIRQIRRAEAQKHSGAEKQTTVAPPYVAVEPSSIRPIIIALTASVLEIEWARILEAGCDDILKKPVREAELFEMIAKHLDIRYVYEDINARASQPIPEEILTPHALATLPSKLWQDLEYAVMQSDVALTTEAINAIRSHNADIADALDMLAKDFKYRPILNLAHEAMGHKDR